MIAALVGAIILMVAAFVSLWIFSPAFRIWAEKPKYTMLERTEAFEHAINDELKNRTDRRR